MKTITNKIQSNDTVKASVDTAKDLYHDNSETKYLVGRNISLLAGCAFLSVGLGLAIGLPFFLSGAVPGHGAGSMIASDNYDATIFGCVCGFIIMMQVFAVPVITRLHQTMKQKGCAGRNSLESLIFHLRSKL